MSDMLILQKKLLETQDGLLTTIRNYAHATTQLNSALRCLVKIKNQYPSVFNECLSGEDILSITEGSNTHGNIKETDS